MIRSLARAASQLPDPPLRRLLLASLALATACFCVLLAALWLALPWVGWLLPATAPQWLRTTIEFVAGAGAVVLSIVLFPGVVMAIQSGLMTERICAAVEARHYPGLPAARSQPVGEAVAMALRFLGASELYGINRNPTPQKQRPRAFGSIEFVRGERERIEQPDVEHLFSEGLHHVAVEDDALRSAYGADFRNRVFDSGFVVCAHDRHQRGIRTDCSGQV